MADSQLVEMREVAQRMVQTAEVALTTGIVSPALQERIARDIGFFASLDLLLAGYTQFDDRVQAAVVQRAADKTQEWLAAGGCSWLKLAKAGDVPN